jgi:hypothetical protein
MSWKDSFPRENIFHETENGILYCNETKTSKENNLQSRFKNNNKI